MSAPVRIRAVLFDLGGTLVGERDFLGWAELGRRFGLELDPEALGHVVSEVERESDASGRRGPSARLEQWQVILDRTLGRPVPRATVERYAAALAELPPAHALFTDVRRALDLLDEAGLRLGIVSNSSSEEAVRAVLERFRIFGRFGAIVSSGTEGCSKPDPEIFRRAVARLGVRPEEALYVGDLPFTDAKGASAAGLYGLWLNRDGTGLGNDPPEITSLLELPVVLHSLAEGGGGALAPHAPGATSATANDARVDLVARIHERI